MISCLSRLALHRRPASSQSVRQSVRARDDDADDDNVLEKKNDIVFHIRVRFLLALRRARDRVRVPGHYNIINKFTSVIIIILIGIGLNCNQCANLVPEYICILDTK